MESSVSRPFLAGDCRCETRRDASCQGIAGTVLQWGVIRTDGYWVWGSDMEFRGHAGIGTGVVAVHGLDALAFLG